MRPSSLSRVEDLPWVTGEAVVVDRELQVQDASRSLRAALDRLSRGAGGRTCHRLLHGREHPCGSDAFPCPALMALELRRSFVVAHTHCRPDGPPHLAMVGAHPLFRGPGRPPVALVSVHDLSAWASVAGELHHRAPALDSVIGRGDCGRIVLNSDYEVLEADPRARKLVGQGRYGLQGRCLLSLVRDPDIPVLRALRPFADRGGEQPWFSLDLGKSPGATRRLQVCFDPCATDGSPSRVALVVRDFDDAPSPDALLACGVEALAFLRSCPTQAVLVATREGTVAGMTPEAEALLSPGRASRHHGATLTEIHGAETVETALAEHDPGLSGVPATRCGPPCVVPVQGSGSARTVTVRACLIRRGSATVGSLWLYEPEGSRPPPRALIGSPDALHMRVFEHDVLGVFLSSRDGRLLDFNERFRRMLGYEDRAELLSIDVGRELYIDPSDREVFKDLVDRNGSVRDHEVQFRTRSGTHTTVLLTAHAVRSRSGEVVGYQGFATDVSAVRDVHDALVLSDRRSALGALAANVAHELDAPLGGILGQAGMLLEQMAADDRARRNVERIVVEARRCQALVARLLELPGPDRDAT